MKDEARVGHCWYNQAMARKDFDARYDKGVTFLGQFKQGARFRWWANRRPYKGRHTGRVTRRIRSRYYVRLDNDPKTLILWYPSDIIAPAGDGVLKLLTSSTVTHSAS